MADELGRWTVTYTKHVKQKRKVYQDGYLLLVSEKKVTLYDDCDKLLESKFLKENENLCSGETLTFGSYLVDIGDSGNADLTQMEKSKKISDTNCTPGRQIRSAINISPSRRIIRDFKKNEKIKCALKERSPSSITSVAGEWHAMYTTHLTQKAKKYHDGFIKLILCGFQARQAKLFDESKDLLSTRFLKKDEIISSGTTLKFDGYLIDIGDSVTNEQLENVNVNAGEQTCNLSEKHNAVGRKRFQLSSSKNIVSSLKSRNFARSYVTAHQLFKTACSGKQVEQEMISCGDNAGRGEKGENSANISSRSGNPHRETSSRNDVEPRPNSYGIDAGRVRLTERSAPNMSFCGGNPHRETSPGKDVEPRPESYGIYAGRVRLTERSAPNTSFCGGNPPNETSSAKDVEQRPKSCSIDEDRVRLTENSAPNIPFRGANEILSFLKKPTPPSSNFATKQSPGKPVCPSPQLVISDMDYKERTEGPAETNSNSGESAKPRVIPSDILRDIKKEKDSNNDNNVQLTSCSAPVFPRVDLENPQPDESASFKGTSGSTSNPLTTNTLSGDVHQHYKTYKADPECNEVGKKPKPVKRPLGIGHRFNKMQPAKIRNSSTTMDECPKFDLGF